MSNFETFKKLHEAHELFILPNAWDAESAAILQQCNYGAVGTSSAAVATTLGYPDGEGMPFAEYLSVIKRIIASVNIPVTVDMEMGYGKTQEEVYLNVQKLLEAGIVGINIEDSVITDGTRKLKNPKTMADLVTYIKSKLKDTKQSLFINVRCDTYLLNVNDKEGETASRLKIYEGAGADGIFLPFISEEEHIATAVETTTLPVNVMAIPNLPDLKTLKKLGVRRVSMGPFLQMKTYLKLKDLAKNVLEQNSLKSIIQP